MRIPHYRGEKFFQQNKGLRDDRMTPLFEAVIKSTEEAILKPLFTEITMKGINGLTIKALPSEDIIRILEKHEVLKDPE